VPTIGMTMCPGVRCEQKATCLRFANPAVYKEELIVWFVASPFTSPTQCEMYEPSICRSGNNDEVSQGECSTPHVAGQSDSANGNQVG